MAWLLNKAFLLRPYITLSRLRIRNEDHEKNLLDYSYLS